MKTEGYAEGRFPKSKKRDLIERFYRELNENSISLRGDRTFRASLMEVFSEKLNTFYGQWCAY